MTISAETVVSVLVGSLVSALVTWKVADLYFRKQERSAEKMAERYFRKQDERAEAHLNILARFLESFAANRSGSATVGFTRDESGRITNASVTVTPGTIESQAIAYPPSVSTAPPRNNTE